MNTDVKNEVDLQKVNETLALLQKRANAGDNSVLPELRQVLDANPEIWKRYGDLALRAETALGQLATGGDLLATESLRRKLAALKTELAGPSPSPLERLLVDRVAATWLQVNYCECRSARTQGVEAAWQKALLKQHDSADRRHLAALKALATVRKLLTPSLSPFDVARRMDSAEANPRFRREGVAGTIGVPN